MNTAPLWPRPVPNAAPAAASWPRGSRPGGASAGSSTCATAVCTSTVIAVLLGAQPQRMLGVGFGEATADRRVTHVAAQVPVELTGQSGDELVEVGDGDLR